MRILFITATRLGDAVLSTALLASLLDAHPGARVTVAGGPVTASLFADVPGLDHFIPMPKQKRGGHWFALWRQVVGRRWDRVIDLRGSLIGYFLRADRVQRWQNPVEVAHRLQQIAACFGTDPIVAPRLWSGEAAQSQAQAWLKADARPLLVLGPTANFIGKQWPLDRFVALAQALTGAGGALQGARLLLIGAPSERPAAQVLFEALPHAEDGFGLADLRVVGAVLQASHLYVGNDSGLMHLAAAAGVPTLGLFGPSPPQLYGPWAGAGPTAFVTTDRPYPQHWEKLKAEPDFLTHMMDDLPVARALAAATALLSRGR
jgi:heptosyltransferase III